MNDKINKKINKEEALLIFKEWGFIEENGNICQKDCKYFKGRILGKATDEDKDASIAYYVLRFNSVLEFFDEVKEEYENNINKKATLEKIYKLLDFISYANSIGNFEALIDEIHSIKGKIETEFSENLAKKEKITQDLQTIIDNKDWRLPVSQIKKMQENFALIGYVQDEKKEFIKKKFRSMVDDYFEKRNEFFEKQEETQKENLKLKEALCLEAENICLSTDWKETSEKLKNLQTKWKEIGSPPPQHINEIWNRFKKSNDIFFKSRQNYFDEQDRIRENNLALKENLCLQAEELSNATDWGDVTKKLIELQKEWENVGSVPREQTNKIWDRFKKANDIFFERRKTFINEEKIQREKNLFEKNRLCLEAEELAPLKGFGKTKDQITELKEKWITIGPVPKDKSEELSLRFRDACNKALQEQ